MIALLIETIDNPNDINYYKNFSSKVFTNNKSLNYFDCEILDKPNELEKFLRTNNVDAILKIKNGEKIKLLNLDNMETKSNLICLSDKSWIIKVPRFFSNKINNVSPIVQSIILTQDEKIENPVLSDEFSSIKKTYKSKKYQEFVVESEKWIFHNMEKTSKQVMLRYYCGLVYYFKLNNIKKALEHLGMAILINPCMSELWCAWGDILLDKKMYEKCKIIYRNAMIAKKHRNIFDRFPIWLDRNKKYPEDMYNKIKESINNIKVIKSINNF